MITLAEELPAECARVRELIGIYLSVGPAGRPAAAMMEHDLRAADAAMVAGDVVGMIGSLTKLRGWKA